MTVSPTGPKDNKARDLELASFATLRHDLGCGQAPRQAKPLVIAHGPIKNCLRGLAHQHLVLSECCRDT